MTLPNRFWMPENPEGRSYVTQGPLAAAPYVECVRVDSLPGWQPIETAPRDGTWFLGFEPGKHLEDQNRVWKWVDDGADWQGFVDAADMNDYDEQPTHWMPLPEPPA